MGVTFSSRKPPSIRTRASRAKVCGLQDTPTTTDALVPVNCCVCSSAPARGGSITMASQPFRSKGDNGRRNRSRAWASMVFRPWAVDTPAFNAAMEAADESAAMTPATSARGKVKVPAPQKRSATFLAPLTASTARLTMAASAAGAACRKAAGGRGTVARPKVMRG
ncbi:hypothetical protein D3C71_645550 [compost metagenome]